MFVCEYETFELYLINLELVDGFILMDTKRPFDYSGTMRELAYELCNIKL